MYNVHLTCRMYIEICISNTNAVLLSLSEGSRGRNTYSSLSKRDTRGINTLSNFDCKTERTEHKRGERVTQVVIVGGLHSNFEMFKNRHTIFLLYKCKGGLEHSRCGRGLNYCMNERKQVAREVVRIFNENQNSLEYQGTYYNNH